MWAEARRLPGGEDCGHAVERRVEGGLKLVRTARSVVLQMAEFAELRRLFQTVLDRIHRLRPAKAASGCRRSARNLGQKPGRAGMDCAGSASAPSPQAATC